MNNGGNSLGPVLFIACGIALAYLVLTQRLGNLAAVFKGAPTALGLAGGSPSPAIAGGTAGRADMANAGGGSYAPAGGTDALSQAQNRGFYGSQFSAGSGTADLGTSGIYGSASVGPQASSYTDYQAELDRQAAAELDQLLSAP